MADWDFQGEVRGLALLWQERAAELRVAAGLNRAEHLYCEAENLSYQAEAYDVCAAALRKSLARDTEEKSKDLGIDGDT